MATGNWSSGDLSTLAEKLKDESKKVNLNLSGVEGLETIGEGAFSGCSSLTSISIPSSVTTIGDKTFNGCSNLAEVTFAEGNKLETIDSYAFSGCSKLTSITIPASVKTIERRAFFHCSKLTTVTFENESKLETIGWAAFVGCSSLTSISIPASVTSIGESAFGACSELATVTMEATTPPALGSRAFDETADTLKILVPKDSVNDYKVKSRVFGKAVLKRKMLGIPVHMT